MKKQHDRKDGADDHMTQVEQPMSLLPYDWQSKKCQKVGQPECHDAESHIPALYYLGHQVLDDEEVDVHYCMCSKQAMDDATKKAMVCVELSVCKACGEDDW